MLRKNGREEQDGEKKGREERRAEGVLGHLLKCQEDHFSYHTLLSEASKKTPPHPPKKHTGTHTRTPDPPLNTLCKCAKKKLNN